MTDSQNEPGDSAETGEDQSRSVLMARAGIVLILISGVLWFSLFAIPFLPLTVGQKTALAGGVFVGVQIAWWSGAALAGPRVVGKIKGLWKRKKE